MSTHAMPRQPQRCPSPSRALLSTLLLGLLALSLSSCEAAPSAPEPAPEEPPGLRGARIRILDSSDIEEIARLEDARSDGDGALQAHLTSGAPLVRERAATALGRLPLQSFGEGVTTALCQSLEDPDLDVRLAAIFALGMRADPASAGVLLAYINDADAEIRARVVEAASRLPETDELRAAVLLAMEDPEFEVVIQAVVGTIRWSPEAPDAGEVDTALLAVLKPFRAPFHAVTEPHPDVVWYTLFALQYRGAEKGRGAFVELAASSSPLARLFSVRGLNRLDPDEAGREVLLARLEDEDWRIAYEAARGLGRGDYAGVLPGLARASHHPVSHVRAAALTSMAAHPEEDERLEASLTEALEDPSIPVRAAALEGLAVVLGEAALPLLDVYGEDLDWRLRAAATRGAALLPSGQAVPYLIARTQDGDLVVVEAALEGLGQHHTLESQTALVEHLASADNGLRMAALAALEPVLVEAHFEYLTRAAGTASGEGAVEVRAAVLGILGELGGPEALAVIQAALGAQSPYLRRIARRELAEHFPDAPVPDLILPPARPDTVPQAGRQYPRYERNPLVEILTERGALVVELFPAEAPIHVYNFLQLAIADHYDGTRFHRVVPDFVAQGGDHRGDGNGAWAWRGGTLRHEISPRRYVRGSLGMPRGEDLESGGCQLFLTHRPTPHLDGRYTLFGELREGFEVLDTLEWGDRILDVRQLP